MNCSTHCNLSLDSPLFPGRCFVMTAVSTACTQPLRTWSETPLAVVTCVQCVLREWPLTHARPLQANAQVEQAKKAADQAADALMRLERRLQAEQAGLAATASMQPIETSEGGGLPEAPALPSAEEIAAITDDLSLGATCKIAADDPRFAYGVRVRRAQAALEAAQREAASAQAAAEARRVGQTAPFVCTQPYWTKGIACTLDGHLAALEAGVPLAGVVYAHAPAPAAEGGTVMTAVALPELVQRVRDAAAGAAWDAPTGRLASVVVAVGPRGGPFVDPSVYAAAQGEEKPLSAKKGAKGAPAVPSGPLVGGHELPRLFKALARCATQYREWTHARTLHELVACPAPADHYQALADSVPAQQQTVPLLLHCMLEQVSSPIDGIYQVHMLNRADQIATPVNLLLLDKSFYLVASRFIWLHAAWQGIQKPVEMHGASMRCGRMVQQRDLVTACVVLADHC